MTTLNRGKAMTYLISGRKVYRFTGKQPNEKKTPATNVWNVPERESPFVIAETDTPQTDCVDCQWFDYMTGDEFIAYYDEQLAAFDMAAGGVPYYSLEPTGCCDEIKQQVSFTAITFGAAQAALYTGCEPAIAIFKSSERIKCLTLAASMFLSFYFFKEAVEEYYDCTQGCLASAGGLSYSYSLPCEKERLWKRLS